MPSLFLLPAAFAEELATRGYDAEWECIPAGAVGAYHERDRVWILAYPDGQGEHAGAVNAEVASVQTLGNAHRSRRADAKGIAASTPRPRLRTALASAYADYGAREWPAEPDVVRVVDGISSRLDASAIRALGNAVVPQIPEIIGRAIMRHAHGK